MDLIVININNTFYYLFIYVIKMYMILNNNDEVEAYQVGESFVCKFFTNICNITLLESVR